MAPIKVKTNRLTEKRKKIKKKDKGRKGVQAKKNLRKPKILKKSKKLKNKKTIENKEVVEQNTSAFSKNYVQPAASNAQLVDIKSNEKKGDINEAVEMKNNEKNVTEAMEIDERMDTAKSFNTEDERARTVFVGNLPLSVTPRILKYMFAEYGEVDSARISCSALNPSKLPRKVALQKRDFHPKATNLNGYVKFKKSESVTNALSANGKIYEEHTLRVDHMLQEIPDYENCIFVGNLPFVVKDDELRNLFKCCGEIENVRIIRDKEYGISRGFGYVNFKSPDSVEFALRLEGSKIRNREIRIKRAAKKFGTKKERTSDEALTSKQSNSKVKKVKKLKVKSDKMKKESLAFQGRTVADKVIKKKKNKHKLLKQLQRKKVIEILNKN